MATKWKLNREKLNKLFRRWQPWLNLALTRSGDWLKLALIGWQLAGKVPSVRSAALLVTRLKTEWAQFDALPKFARLNHPFEIDQFCAVWYSTRHNGLGRLLAQKGWVASQPLEIRVLSALQANRPEMLSKDEVFNLAQLLRLCRQETDLVLARRAAEALDGVQDLAVVQKLVEGWQSQNIEPLFSLEEVKPYLTAYPSGLRVLVALKIPRLELLTEAEAGIIEPLLAIYQGQDVTLAELARQVLLGLENPATRDKLCDLALQPEQPLARQLALEAGYYPREPHQRALFFFLTGQWEKYENLDFDRSLLKFRYEAADDSLRRRIVETARLAGRAEIVVALVSGGGRGLTRQRLRAMNPAEWQLVVNLLLEAERWEEAWELVQFAPAIYSARILKRLAEVSWYPAQPIAGMAFVELAAKAQECEGLYPPLGRQLRIETKLCDHSGPVNTLAISPDGELLVSGGTDGTLRFWQLPEGQLLTTLKEELVPPAQPGKHLNNSWVVKQVAFSPDGKYLAVQLNSPLSSGEWASVVQLLNVAERRVERILENYSFREQNVGLAFSPNGQLLAVAVQEKVHIWDLGSKQLIKRLSKPLSNSYWWLPTPVVTCVAFSNDGRWLASGENFGRVLIWRMPDGEAVQELNLVSLYVTALIFTPDSTGLFAAHGIAHLELIVVPDGTLLRKFYGHYRHSHTLAISPDGERLASGHFDAVRLWNVPEQRPVKTMEARLNLVLALAFSPDGQWLISGDEYGQIIFWSTRLAKLARATLEQIGPEDLQFSRQAQKDPALPWAERKWLEFVEGLLGWQLRLLIEAGQTLAGQKWLASIEALLGWQLLHEIELDAAPLVQAADFDIELESL